MNKDLKKLIEATTKKMPTLIRDARVAGIVKRAHLESPQLNYAFGGEFPIGRVIHLFGPFSAGKSSLANYLAGQLQRRVHEVVGNPDKKIVIYADFERSFDVNHAQENGLLVDDEHLVFMQPDDIESFVDAVIPMIKTGAVAAMILDSEAAAPTRVEMVDEAGKANFGANAKAMAQSIKKLNIVCANNDTTYIVISQERANMNPQAHLPTVTGGTALPFYASWRGRITKIDTIEEKNDTIGINMRIKNYKSKVGVPFRQAEVKLYYKGGFDSNDEYIDFLIKFNLVSLKGSWLSSEKYGFNVQGRTKLAEWLNAHEEIYDELKKQVDEKLKHRTEELDADNAEPEDAREVEAQFAQNAELNLTEEISDEISEEELKENDA